MAYAHLAVKISKKNKNIRSVQQLEQFPILITAQTITNSMLNYQWWKLKVLKKTVNQSKNLKKPALLHQTAAVINLLVIIYCCQNNNSRNQWTYQALQIHLPMFAFFVFCIFFFVGCTVNLPVSTWNQSKTKHKKK